MNGLLFFLGCFNLVMSYVNFYMGVRTIENHMRIRREWGPQAPEIIVGKWTPIVSFLGAILSGFVGVKVLFF